MNSTNQFCYSCEGDDYCVRDLSELIESHELGLGHPYIKHDLVQNEPSHYFHIDDMLESMGDRADEDAGECAEGFPNISEADKAELDSLICNWLNQKVNVSFFKGLNPQECAITADDLEAKGIES